MKQNKHGSKIAIIAAFLIILILTGCNRPSARFESYERQRVQCKEEIRTLENEINQASTRKIISYDFARHLEKSKARLRFCYAYLFVLDSKIKNH